MKNPLDKTILFFLVIIFFTACKEDNIYITENHIDKEYFPLKTSNTITYKVTEINIDAPSDVFDTNIYFLKEIIDIPFIDSEGDTAYRIERYISLNNDYWKIYQVWSAKTTKTNAELVEENNRIVKLKFPITLNKQWNGNLLNSLEPATFKLNKLNFNYYSGGINYNDCISVLQDSSFSIINKDYEYEIYAKHIGLIYKEITHINSQIITPDIDIEMRVTTSYVYKQEILSYNIGSFYIQNKSF